MSRNIKTVVGRHEHKDIYVSSHSAGAAGQCLQLVQGDVNNLQTIEVDKAQVVELYEAFGEWLNKDNPDNHVEVLCNLLDAVTDARRMAVLSDTSTTPISQRLVKAHTAACDWWVKMKTVR